jgi:hypothetical protein
MSNWHIGQKVVFVGGTGDGNPPRGFYRGPAAIYVGDIVTIRGVGACKCVTLLDVGINTPRPDQVSACEKCGHVQRRDGAWWLDACQFRPLDTLTETIERIEEEGAPVELEMVQP